ncbi:unnamed protein product [Parnassius apollo]|uniref:(apollo) hypothetical protein n=1 Tax=Parnassius apollo TaxID=110799 RepID=A0A8S3XA24_PARAO|nr:unnamed protein product [Parnassius apollo]
MEPCIWNPKDANHKDKKKQADAWIRLAELTGRPVKEIKNKKEIEDFFSQALEKKNVNLCVLAQQSQQIKEDTDQTEDDSLIRDRTSTVTTPSTLI